MIPPMMMDETLRYNTQQTDFHCLGPPQPEVSPAQHPLQLGRYI
jgi:hypothetical protein